MIVCDTRGKKINFVNRIDMQLLITEVGGVLLKKLSLPGAYKQQIFPVVTSRQKGGTLYYHLLAPWISMGRCGTELQGPKACLKNFFFH